MGSQTSIYSSFPDIILLEFSPFWKIFFSETTSTAVDDDAAASNVVVAADGGGEDVVGDGDDELPHAHL